MRDGMYESFAQVYDMFMDNVPYEAWKEYILRELKKENIESGTVVKLKIEELEEYTEYL